MSSRDLAALLENLPEIKAQDYSELPRWKRRDLMLTEEQLKKRYAAKQRRQRKKYRTDAAYREKVKARANAWHAAKRQAALPHGMKSK